MCCCVIATVVLASRELRAQEVSAVGSNLLRIGSGTTDQGIGGITRKRYLEEIANARIFFSNITLGLRYEMDDPSEVGQSFQGLRRRWINYKKDNLDLTAGNVTSLYGRGLTINNFESRALNYDAWIDGISGSYEYKWNKNEFDFRPSLGVHAMAGTLTFVDISGTGVPDLGISARTVNGEFGLFGKKVLVGASFLQAFTTVSAISVGRTVETDREVNQPEIYVSFLQDEYSGHFQFTEMRQHLDQVRSKRDSASHIGKAMYGALSYAGEKLGLTVEYKNYQYNLYSPTNSYATYFSKLPLSSPPEVYKDFTYTSLTRSTHSVNFDDELGFQVEANITAIPDVVITLNAAASSRHNSFSGVDSSGKPIVKTTTDFLPKFSDDGLFPFWEYFAEVEYEFGTLSYIKGFFHRRSDFRATAAGVVGNPRIRNTTVGLKCQYETTPSQSLLVTLEHQWSYDEDRAENNHQLNNELLIAQYSFNPGITFGGLLDYSTWYDANRHFWPQAFVSTRIGGAHTLLMSYGAERGGLNCTGGVCRVVPAFNGLRFTLTSQI